MGKLYNGGITTTSNFKFESEAPLDDRLSVETIGDLDSLIKYEGMIVYVQSEHKHYTYINESWAILSDELVKLEAEGWVTELVLRIADPATLVIGCQAYNLAESPIVAIKANDELVDFTVNRNASGNITDCRLSLGMPVGTTIKIYHDPDFTGSLEFTVHENQYDGVDIRPFYDILKSVRRINSLTYCCFNICNDVPSSVDLLAFRFGNEVTAKITAPLLGLSVCEAFDGKHIQVHLATLPSDMIQVLTDRPLEDKIYVPYHLLEDAKAKFPEQAKYIDALVPATDYNLAKLEAEGWVTELVVSGGTLNALLTYVDANDVTYDENNEPIIAIKVNDELVENILNEYNSYDTQRLYEVVMPMPVGTIIKIYHNPNLSSKSSIQLELNGNGSSLEINKFVKRVYGFSVIDYEVSCCHSLPLSAEFVEFYAGAVLTKIPAGIKQFKVFPAVDDSNEWYHLDFHYDELPPEGSLEFLLAGGSDCITIYVPYHLLEEAKARFPAYAEHIDAFAPTSEVSEVVKRVDDIESYTTKPVVFASYVETIETVDVEGNVKQIPSEVVLEAETIKDLLYELYKLFVDENTKAENIVLANKKITYRIYGYNEFSGHSIEGVPNKVDFSINGTFEDVEFLGYNNARLKFVSDELIGPGFLLARQGAEGEPHYNTNASIHNISFLRETLNSSSWEHLYLKFYVGYDGTLLLDNCLFLDDELLLQYGVNVSVRNCKFNSGPDKYGLWVGVNAFGSKYLDTLQDVTIDNCVFTGCRGIKVLTDVKTTSTVTDAYVEGKENQTREKQSIVVQDCVFKDLTEKPGIVIDCLLSESSFSTGESTIDILNTKFINCQDVTTTQNKGINYSIESYVKTDEIADMETKSDATKSYLPLSGTAKNAFGLAQTTERPYISITNGVAMEVIPSKTYVYKICLNNIGDTEGEPLFYTGLLNARTFLANGVTHRITRVPIMPIFNTGIVYVEFLFSPADDEHVSSEYVDEDSVLVTVNVYRSTSSDKREQVSVSGLVDLRPISDDENYI